MKDCKAQRKKEKLFKCGMEKKYCDSISGTFLRFETSFPYILSFPIFIWRRRNRKFSFIILTSGRWEKLKFGRSNQRWNCKHSTQKNRIFSRKKHIFWNGYFLYYGVLPRTLFRKTQNSNDPIKGLLTLITRAESGNNREFRGQRRRRLTSWFHLSAAVSFLRFRKIVLQSGKTFQGFRVIVWPCWLEKKKNSHIYLVHK